MCPGVAQLSSIVNECKPLPQGEARVHGGAHTQQLGPAPLRRVAQRQCGVRRGGAGAGTLVPRDRANQILLATLWDAITLRRERERDASACMRRHQAFALAPVPLRWRDEGSKSPG